MIASEGKIILIPTFLILIVGVLSYLSSNDNLIWLRYFNYLTCLFLFFSLYFFREPSRKIIDIHNQMLSPADGKVLQIIDIEDSDIGPAKQISIFLSVFNIHSQYVPIDGKVLSSEYFPGKYLMAFNHKASDQNERTSITFQTNSNHNYKIRQIAGFIARRILNYMVPGEEVNKGKRLGFIRFGSRVDIVVPKNDFNIIIAEGDKVKANLSPIGEFV